MIRIKALLFDFDGVLADTEPFHWKAWLEVLAPYSPDLDWPTYERVCIGICDAEMRNIFSKLCRKHITPDDIRDLYAKKRQIFQDLTKDSGLVDSELVGMLAGLKGLDLAVVTSSNQAEVEPILQKSGLHSVLTTTVYGNDVQRYKPFPDPYLLAMHRLQVEPSESVVYEDSATGIRSGKDAGCRVVEVKNPLELRRLVRSTLEGSCDF